MKHHDGSEPQVNELKALVAVMRDGTVTRAAQVLGLTQSTLSYQLDRMRKHFGDPLFVRVGNRMVPTPLAQQLAEPAARVLRILDTEIAGLGSFDPLTTEREFRVGLNEIGAITLLPKLVQRMAVVAPRACLVPVPVDAGSLASALESGAMDVAAGHFHQPDGLLRQQLLYRRDYVCVVRRNNPRIGASITMLEFSRMPRVETPTVQVTRAWLDTQLRQRNLQGSVHMSTLHVGAIPFIVAASDHVALIPREVYELFAPIAAIKTVKLPIDIPAIAIHQYWHPRVGSDPAVTFLRELVYEVTRPAPSAIAETRAVPRPVSNRQSR